MTVYHNPALFFTMLMRTLTPDVIVRPRFARFCRQLFDEAGNASSARGFDAADLVRQLGVVLDRPSNDKLPRLLIDVAIAYLRLSDAERATMGPERFLRLLFAVANPAHGAVTVAARPDGTWMTTKFESRPVTIRLA